MVKPAIWHVNVLKMLAALLDPVQVLAGALAAAAAEAMEANLESATAAAAQVISRGMVEESILSLSSLLTL